MFIHNFPSNESFANSMFVYQNYEREELYLYASIPTRFGLKKWTF